MLYEIKAKSALGEGSGIATSKEDLNSFFEFAKQTYQRTAPDMEFEVKEVNSMEEAVQNYIDEHTKEYEINGIVHLGGKDYAITLKVNGLSYEDAKENALKIGINGLEVVDPEPEYDDDEDYDDEDYDDEDYDSDDDEDCDSCCC